MPTKIRTLTVTSSVTKNGQKIFLLGTKTKPSTPTTPPVTNKKIRNKSRKQNNEKLIELLPQDSEYGVWHTSTETKTPHYTHPVTQILNITHVSLFLPNFKKNIMTSIIFI